MKPLAALLAVFLVLALVAPGVQAASPSFVIPTTQILSVSVDSSVTLKTFNFPANDKFDVYMNTFGTLGIGGVKVATVDSGAGGSLTFTFNIPDSLKGLSRIAIRLQSPTSGYYAYDWFDNKTGGTTTPGTPSGVIPTFSIVSVEKDSKVTIQTANFPKNLKFDVLMNTYGTLGVGGVKADTVDSAGGGTLSFTFSIPASLKGLDRIAIRLQSQTTVHYAYNWFWNSPSSGSTGTPSLPAGVIPTFSISAVVQDSTVTIKTANFPASDKFDVYMGAYGTLGVGGVKVGTIDTGTGGVLTQTFNIPDSLKGSSRIAIRAQSPTSGYFSFNWFWNSTYP